MVSNVAANTKVRSVKGVLVLKGEERYRRIIFPSEVSGVPLNLTYSTKVSERVRYSVYKVLKKINSENRARHECNSDGTS